MIPSKDPELDLMKINPRYVVDLWVIADGGGA
jgi:hypothetical protein